MTFASCSLNRPDPSCRTHLEPAIDITLKQILRELCQSRSNPQRRAADFHNRIPRMGLSAVARSADL
jgi:hypothetical protein